MDAFSSIIFTPIGQLGIQTTQNRLVRIEILTKPQKNSPPKTILGKKIACQLKQYFKNPKFQFDLPIQLNGTKFQKQIWCILMKIPSGQILTYGKLAKQLQTNPRVIGNACRANPIPIIVPCHRIIGKKHLGGYCGQKIGRLLNKKQLLLQHEKEFSD